MESNTKAGSAKRFVVEDDITYVTSDGEPHEMMTIVAGLSGLFAAIVILIVLVTLIGCGKRKQQNCRNCPSNADKLSSGSSLPTSETDENHSAHSSISTCITRPASRATDVENAGDYPVRESASVTISVIGSGNMKGNLNEAFVRSELCLNESLSKKKKKTRWSDEMEQQGRTKETAIVIERY